MRFLVFVLVTVLSGVAPAQSQQPGVYRTRTDLVALDMTVKDRAGRFVETLEAGDFLVLEDDVPQKLLFFWPGGRAPLAIALLIDHSQSMVGEPLRRAKLAAASFLRNLHPEDVVEVIAFSDVPERIYPLGDDKVAAAQAIERLEAGGGTRLYETILMAQRDLERGLKGAANESRKSIVFLSDGDDTRSALPFEALLDDARSNTTSINVISLRMDQDAHALPLPREMIQLARDTGGQAIAIRRLADLSSAYECIQDDLRRQYRLGYISSSLDKDGGWRRISVKVRDSSLVVRTRSGYLAPSKPSPRAVP